MKHHEKGEFFQVCTTQWGIKYLMALSDLWWIKKKKKTLSWIVLLLLPLHDNDGPSLMKGLKMFSSDVTSMGCVQLQSPFLKTTIEFLCIHHCDLLVCYTKVCQSLIPSILLTKMRSIITT